MPKRTCILLIAAAVLAASPLTDERPARAGAPGALNGAADSHDLSAEREAHYTHAVRQWLATLPPLQQMQARKILQEAHPGVHALRERIREKKAELAALSFDSTTPPDTLPRLGRELQILREQLRRRLLRVSDKLRDEVGVPMGPLRDEGFWLNPPFDDKNTGTRGAPVHPGKATSAAMPVSLPVFSAAAVPLQR